MSAEQTEAMNMRLDFQGMVLAMVAGSMSPQEAAHAVQVIGEQVVEQLGRDPVSESAEEAVAAEEEDPDEGAFAHAAWAEKSCRIMSTEGYCPAGHKLDADYGQRWSKTLVQQMAAAARRLGGPQPCRLIFSGRMQEQKPSDIIRLDELIERVRCPVAEPPASSGLHTKHG